MSTECKPRSVPPDVASAITAFQRGDPVLIHDFDDREGEVDIVYPADAVTPADVATLRNEAGGLICVAITDAAATTLQLPFVKDAVDHPTAACHDLQYDDRSSFSLSVNHRETNTGVTDRDRARTITELAATARAPDLDEFAASFRSPGHVPILRGAPGLLSNRQGHTELGLALADAAGVDPAVVVSEMLDDRTGDALPKRVARRFARDRDLPFVDGAQLVRTLS